MKNVALVLSYFLKIRVHNANTVCARISFSHSRIALFVATHIHCDRTVLSQIPLSCHFVKVVSLLSCFSKISNICVGLRDI